MRGKKNSGVAVLRSPRGCDDVEVSAKANTGKRGAFMGSKYKARGSQETDGFFASQKELKRYRALQLREKAGEIRDLKRQVRHKLIVNGVLIATYVSDAEYVEVSTGKHIVEDTKSPMTKKLAPYRMKRALMLALHGVRILET